MMIKLGTWVLALLLPVMAHAETLRMSVTTSFENSGLADVLLPAAGMGGLETAVSLQELSKASDKLRYVSGNAAIKYHTGELTREQTIDYIQTYALATPERAAKSFSFLSHPLYRSYIFTYTQGYDLMQASDVKYGRLLTDQILPSQL